MKAKTIVVAGLLGLATPALADGDMAPIVTKGHDAYDFLCSKCHGKNLVNPGTSSFDLRKFPQDDRARFEDSVLHGKGDMPAWQDVLLPGELDALWAYVVTRAGEEPLPEGIDPNGGPDG